MNTEPTDTNADEAGCKPSVEALICPQCGADLDVPEGIQTLRCRFCGTSLRLKESGSVRGLAIIEQKLDRIIESTERTEKKVDGLAEEQQRPQVVWQEEHDRLNAEWEAARKDLETAWSKTKERLESALRIRATEANRCRDAWDEAESRLATSKWAACGITVIPFVLLGWAVLTRASGTTVLVLLVASCCGLLVGAVSVGTLSREVDEAKQTHVGASSSLHSARDELQRGEREHRNRVAELAKSYEQQLAEWEKRRPL